MEAGTGCASSKVASTAGKGSWPYTSSFVGCSRLDSGRKLEVTALVLTYFRIKTRDKAASQVGWSYQPWPPALGVMDEVSLLVQGSFTQAGKVSVTLVLLFGN